MLNFGAKGLDCSVGFGDKGSMPTIATIDEGDHLFVWLPDQQPEGVYFDEGWRIEYDGDEIDRDCDFGATLSREALVEWFDAEANALYPCSIIPHTDLWRAVNDALRERERERRWNEETRPIPRWQGEEYYDGL